MKLVAIEYTAGIVMFYIYIYICYLDLLYFFLLFICLFICLQAMVIFASQKC